MRSPLEASSPTGRLQEAALILAVAGASGAATAVPAPPPNMEE
jgi:hypothetical protein